MQYWLEIQLNDKYFNGIYWQKFHKMHLKNRQGNGSYCMISKWKLKIRIVEIKFKKQRQFYDINIKQCFKITVKMRYQMQSVSA